MSDAEYYSVSYCPRCGGVISHTWSGNLSASTSYVPPQMEPITGANGTVIGYSQVSVNPATTTQILSFPNGNWCQCGRMDAAVSIPAVLSIAPASPDEGRESLGQGLEELTVGSLVHYVLESGPHQGEHRPAIVVRTWKPISEEAVNLQVFTDGPNDAFESSHYLREADAAFAIPLNTIWRTSVHYSADHEPGTWHWMERPDRPSQQ